VKVGIVIAAAGQGKRMGAKIPKQFIELKGKPVLYHSICLFNEHPFIQEIVVVTSKEDIAQTEEITKDLTHVTVVEGGKERQESVLCGLKALRNSEFVLIHDAARPFATQDLINRLIARVAETGAVIPAVPVKDTIKVVNEKREVQSTPPRQSLWAVQTPQAFRLSTILEAHHWAQERQFLGTDDATLLEAKGLTVHVIDGEYSNIKLTTPEDLQVAEKIIEKKGGEKDV